MLQSPLAPKKGLELQMMGSCETVTGVCVCVTGRTQRKKRQASDEVLPLRSDSRRALM